MKMRIWTLALTSILLLSAGSVQAQWRGGGWGGGGYGGGWGSGYGASYSNRNFGVGYGTNSWGGNSFGLSYGNGNNRFSVGGTSYPGYGYGYGSPYYGGYSGSGYYPSGGYYSGNTFYPSSDYSTSSGYYPSTTSFYSPSTVYSSGSGVINSAYSGPCGSTVYPSTATTGATTSFYQPDANMTMGLQISELENNRPAKQAGLRQADIIMSVGTTRTQTADELSAALAKVTGETEITVLMIPSMKSEKIKVKPVDGKIGATVSPVPVPPQPQ